MTRKFEFTIEAPGSFTSRGSVRIAGRCCTSELRLGDVFKLIYRVSKAKNLVDYGKPGKPEVEEVVFLQVDLITAYGRELDRLAAGLTAELELSGTGVEKVQEGWVLSGIAT